MRISISIGSAYYNGEEWDSLVDYTMAADRIGVDEAWSAEAWGMDAIVPLAYLAAKTENIRLGTGIMQISSRVPSMMAMTAQSLDTVSKGRFNMGLGVSGPQVVEGLHGASFAKPLSRLRECMAILRMALNGEKLQYEENTMCCRVQVGKASRFACLNLQDPTCRFILQLLDRSHCK